MELREVLGLPASGHLAEPQVSVITDPAPPGAPEPSQGL